MFTFKDGGQDAREVFNIMLVLQEFFTLKNKLYKPPKTRTLSQSNTKVL